MVFNSNRIANGFRDLGVLFLHVYRVSIMKLSLSNPFSPLFFFSFFPPKTNHFPNPLPLRIIPKSFPPLNKAGGFRNK